jgi:hypothetical protein
MPRRSRLQNVALFFVILIGLAPVIYFTAVEIGAAEAAQDSPETNIPADKLDRFVENLAFGVGEHLEFDIRYGFITAGTATMSVKRLIEFETRPCFLIETTAQSNSFFNTFYKVDDKVESIIDAIGMYSWRFEKNLSEGKYRAHRQISFDQRNNLAYYSKAPDHQDTIKVPDYVQDVLSVFYYVRTQPLEVGRSIFVDNYNDGKLNRLEVKVLEKETVTVSAGTFECFVVEPLLKSVGVFKHEGQLKVWLTTDRLRLPVLMKSKVLVGSIAAELTNYKLGEIEVY